MTIFCDIDGTLTMKSARSLVPRKNAIAQIKKLIAQKKDDAIVWSGKGKAYAERFCAQHGIRPSAIIGKPDVVIDDRETPRQRVRWCGHPVTYISPEDFAKRGVE